MGKGNISLVLVAVLAIMGAVLSSIGLHEYAVNFISNQIGIDPKSSFCDINSEFNCTAVNQSSWAVWLGVPVAAYGLWFFLSLLSGAILLADKERFSEQDKSDLLSLYSLVGAIVSVVLFYISKFIIGVFCPVCLGVYAVSILLLILVLVQRQRRKSFIVSAKDGLVSSIGFIFEVIDPKGRNRAVSVRLFVLSVVIAALGSYTAKDFFSIRYLASLNNEPKWEDEPVRDISLNLSEDASRDYWRGAKDAAITLVEFADYECPACQVIYFVIDEILKKYDGQVLYVYKNYPLDSTCNPSIKTQMHENACLAAAYARCAGEKGKFWEMSEYLFKLGMNEEEFDSSQYQQRMKDGIRDLGFSQSEFDACLNSSSTKSKILSDISEGDRLALTGTPSIFINGRLVRDVSFDGIESVISSIISQK